MRHAIEESTESFSSTIAILQACHSHLSLGSRKGSRYTGAGVAISHAGTVLQASDTRHILVFDLTENLSSGGTTIMGACRITFCQS
jgi:hypothetical protein